MGEELFLGVDIGTSGTKAIAVGRDGVPSAAASAAHPTRTPGPGAVEQEPGDWWGSVRRSVGEVLHRLPDGPRAIAGIGLSGHMSSLVVLGADGQPLRPCITVADGRGEAEAEELGRRFGPRFERLAGWHPGTSDVAPKLLWLKVHEPAVHARMSKFVFAKDYVRYLLTGDLATDPTDAGNTFFLDLSTRTWDAALYADMGHDPATLPPLVATTSVAGSVTRDAAMATGLLPGTPVVAGAADMAASMVGTAAVEPGIVAVTIGTSAQVTTPVTKLLPEARGRVDFHPHADPGLLYVLGSIFSGGLTVRWLARAFGEEEDLAARGDAYVDELSSHAAAAHAGGGGALFLPFLVGSGTPDFDPLVRAAWLGLSLGTGRAELVRAALEGVAHDARQSVELLDELGLPVERIHLAGGGTASETWRGIIAGVLGRAVLPTRVRDASALGAAALAGVGLGAFGDVVTAARTMVTFAEPLEPEPKAVERYARDHEAYLDARGALRDVHRRHRSWGESGT